MDEKASMCQDLSCALSCFKTCHLLWWLFGVALCRSRSMGPTATSVDTAQKLCSIPGTVSLVGGTCSTCLELAAWKNIFPGAIRRDEQVCALSSTAVAVFLMFRRGES
eukprot:5932492-Amphidinium_carterae.1